MSRVVSRARIAQAAAVATLLAAFQPTQASMWFAEGAFVTPVTPAPDQSA